MSLVRRHQGSADWPVHGPRRHGRPKRQRPIRSTITILLVIPLVSLIALWAYAATSTVGGALARQNADELNTDLGGPLQALIAQLDAERADTFTWQSAHGVLPRDAPAAERAALAAQHTALVAQRGHTNAAVTAFRAGAAAGAGLEPAAAKPLAAALLAQLSQLPAIRARVDAGTISPLRAFEDYNDMAATFYPFSIALTNPDESLSMFAEAQGAVDEGEATDDIAQEAALVGGAMVTGDRLSAGDYRLFVQTVDDQRLLQQAGDTPLDWQQSPDPYPRIYASPAFVGFTALQNNIIGAGPDGRLPVAATAWESSVGAVFGELTAAETTERLGVTRGDTHAGDVILLRLVLVGGAGLLAVVVSSLMLLGFGNRISRELRALRGAARTLADERLPSVVSRLRAGGEVDVDAEAPPLALPTKTREVTETAAAFSAVQRTAVEAAVEQAQLRKGVSLVFRSLSRRNQSLLQRQLRILDEMERGTEDPDALAQLFRLDHLTTRMRRQAEGLIVLSGAAPGRGWRQPVPVVDVLRGAIGEIEDYSRVDIVADTPDFMQGAAVADVTHLLAELVENAVSYAPPTTRVQVKCGRVANGYAIEIEDRGLGIPEETRHVLNERLAMPPEFDLADTDQLGLFVVSRLAARHQIRVALRTSAYGGTLAIVLLPHSLVVSEEESIFLAAGGAAAAPRVARGFADPGSTSGWAATGPADAGPVPALPVRSIPMRSTLGRMRVSGPIAAVQVPDQAHSGLPRREPMANMAPQLREDGPGTPKGPLAGRSPEQARALLSAIRQGWQSGLSAADAADGESQGSGPDGGQP